MVADRYFTARQISAALLAITLPPLMMTASGLSRLARLLFVLALPLSAAHAHPRLMNAVPAAEGRVGARPRALTLTFNESLAVVLCRVSLLDQTSQLVKLDTLRAGVNDAKTLTATILGPLSSGRYTVKWQAAGADGHPVRGEYTFTIDADTTGTGLASASRPAPASDFGVESPTYAAIRAVQSIAVVALLGILALQLVVLPRYARQATANAELLRASKRASLPWLTIALSTIGVATVARFGAQHAALFGAAEGWSPATVGAMLLHSGWGLAWCLAAVGTAVGFWALGRIRRERPHAWLLLTASTLVLVVTIAMSGHAAAASSPITAMAVHALHVVGAGGWMGSLAALMIIAIPTAMRTDADDTHQMVAGLLNAFSPTALVFAGLVAVTGAIAAWRNLGAVEELWRSTYGQVLLLKMATLSVAAATGAYNWKRVLPSLGTVTGTARLRTSASVELAAALAVLLITAILVATPMPIDMVAPLGS